MKSAVIVFPGSNCDRDAATALERASGRPPLMVWHRETELPPVDLIVLPGGFAYGDYLRAGAIAARSPVMAPLCAAARRGVAVLGICNGFQILTEAGLLPGALLPNVGGTFISRPAPLRVETTDSIFTARYRAGQVIRLPLAHHDGAYQIAEDERARLAGEGLIAFRYCDAAGGTDAGANPNGSVDNIAGVLDPGRRVLGLMPHPERAADAALGGTDGALLFTALAELLA